MSRHFFPPQNTFAAFCPALLSSLSPKTLRSVPLLLSGRAPDKSSELRGAHSCSPGCCHHWKPHLSHPRVWARTDTYKHKKAFSTRGMCRMFNAASKEPGLQPQVRLLSSAHFLLSDQSCKPQLSLRDLKKSIFLCRNNSCTKRSWQLNPAHWISVCSRINPDYLT